MDLKSIIFSLIITMFLYLLVPVVLSLRSNKYSQKKIKRIAIINGLIVWLIINAVKYSISLSTASLAVTLFWSWIGYGLMEHKILLEA